MIQSNQELQKRLDAINTKNPILIELSWISDTEPEPETEPTKHIDIDIRNRPLIFKWVD